MLNVVNMSVRGQKMNVHVERPVSQNTWAARVYVNSKTVSGFLRKSITGALRFSPIGKNADLLASRS